MATICEERLTALGQDMEDAHARDEYISLEAEETLTRFMKNGWPDDERFVRVVQELLARAKKNGRKARAFGEMVAVVWAGASTVPPSTWNICGINCARPRASLYYAHTRRLDSRRTHLRQSLRFARRIPRSSFTEL